MKVELFNKSLLFLIEKLLSSVSRYAVTFYCLAQLTNGGANKFFHQSSVFVFLFVACHFGLDNYLIGRINNGLGVEKFYLLRFFGAVLAFFLYLMAFANLSAIILILLFVALIGVALPIIQTMALVSGSVSKIVRWRVMPEALSALLRIVSMVVGLNDPELMLVVFFSSEIIGGFISIFMFAFKCVHYRDHFNLDIHGFWKISDQEFKSLGFGVIIIILIFMFQRGDVLLWTSINHGEMSSSLRSVIKSQQFFDMAGVLAVAAVPMLLRLKVYQKAFIPVFFAAICFLSCHLFLLWVLDVKSLSILFHRILGSYDMALIPVFASLGLGTYVAMMQLDFSLRQIVVLCCLVVLVLVKLILFFIMIDDRPMDYSLITSFTAFLVFICFGNGFFARHITGSS